MRRNFKLKWKKFCAAALAVGMIVTSCPAGAWGAAGDAGNGCIKVANRGTFTSGPSFDVTGKISTDKTYTVSMKIKYTGTKDSRTFEVYMENADAKLSEIWNYRQKLGNVTVKKGEWTEFKKTDYQPGSSSAGKEFLNGHNALVIFTPYADTNNGQVADTDEFYVDDVLIQENSGSEILKEGFDSSAGTAKGVDSAEISWIKEGEESSVKEKNPNNNCLGVLNRTNDGKGVGFKVDGLATGQTYSISAQIMCLSGADTRTINATMQCGDNWKHRNIVKSGKVKKGQWTAIENNAYLLPANGDNGGAMDTSKAILFFETPNNAKDLKDFYIDDVVVKDASGKVLYSEDFEKGLDASKVKVFENAGDAEIKCLKESEMPGEEAEQPKTHECMEGSTLVSGALKAENNNTHVNPLFDYKFGADPYAITYNGRVYVYMTNDSQQLEVNKGEDGFPVTKNGFEAINTLNIFSSADMVNWTDHGEISVAGKGNAVNSWAPAVAHKTIDGKEKFFLYFANSGNGIYVLESDSPIGPFEAPATGSALIPRGTQQSEGVEWLFDPAVLVDDDGTGYLYYGGGVPAGKEEHPQTMRVVKLKDNMVQVDGDAKMIDAPANFEDSGIHKYNGKYYFTYCSNWSSAANKLTEGMANICLMVSDNPMEGFEYKGVVFKNEETFFGPGTGGNNHHCFFEFNGKNYLTYHAQTLQVALGFDSKAGGYRSTHIDEFEYSADGKISVVGTWEGSKQIKALNPYERVEAETIAWSKGIKADACNQEGSLVKGINMKVTEITNGDYLAVSNADFGSGSGKFTMHVAGLAGGTVELHLDGTAGEKVGEVQVPAGDGNTWTDVSCNAAITGNHSLYLVFKGGAGQLMYADYWKFDTKSGSGTGGNGNGDTQLTPEQQSQVDAVIALINKIGTVTNSQASKAAIDAARAAYDKLTDEQKKQVTNFNVLTEAEKTYQEIKAKEDKSPVKKGQSYSSGNYRYKVLNVSKKTVAVTKTLKASKTIKVPNTVKIKGKTFKVTEIAKGAFKNNKKVETVTIGKYATKIGANAFSGSKKLKKVTINSTVLTTIDKQAFYNCKKLATVKIVSKKLKTVAKQSFKGTAKKIKVDVPNSKKKAYKKLFKKNSGISSKAVFK